MKICRFVCCGLLVTILSGAFSRVSADEPGWLPVIVATGELREEIQSTPIHLRPYRPMHFYGNAVRRQYYRGTVLPWPFSPVPQGSGPIIPNTSMRTFGGFFDFGR